jgi:drug/metabolite transporter (DMT)-like permease
MKNWIMFGLLGLIWGSSFLLIKVGIVELSPLELVSGRLGLTAIAFLIAMAVLRKRIPTDRKTLLFLSLIGITNTAIPFVLITTAETTIDSGLAGVLNATVPLFSIVIAHFALHDDKIHGGKLLGLLTGFVGIIILASRSADPNHPNPIEGQIAMLFATFSYAASAVIIRRYLRHVEPFITAATATTFGAVIVIVVTLLFVRPLTYIPSLQAQTVLTVVVLAIVNTFIANSMYYVLISNWGASRATLVVYLMPPISLALGALANQERIDLTLIIGAALIIAGVALANFSNLRKKTGPPMAAAPVDPLEADMEAVDAPPTVPA